MLESLFGKGEADETLAHWQAVNKNGRLMMLAKAERGNLSRALSLYRANKLRARFFKNVVRWIANSPLWFLIRARPHAVGAGSILDHIEKKSGGEILGIVLGNPVQPHRRLLLKIRHKGGASEIVKVGVNRDGIDAVRSELDVIRSLQSYDIRIPSITQTYETEAGFGFGMTDLAGADAPSGTITTAAALNVLTEWRQHGSVMRLRESHLWQSIAAAWPAGHGEKREKVGDLPLECSIFHGDFVAWNLINTPEGVAVVDWEFGKPVDVAGIDLIHFICQDILLLRGLQNGPFVEEALDEISQPVVWAFLSSVGWPTPACALLVYLTSLNDEFAKPDQRHLINLADEILF